MVTMSVQKIYHALTTGSPKNRYGPQQFTIIYITRKNVLAQCKIYEKKRNTDDIICSSLFQLCRQKKETPKHLLITFACSAIFCNEFSSRTSAMMIGMADRSFPALSPISFSVRFNFSSSRPATPHDKFSSNLTPSKTVYLPAATTKKCVEEKLCKYIANLLTETASTENNYVQSIVCHNS